MPPSSRVNHHAHDPIEMEGGTVFYFVTDGFDVALEQAKAAAGARRTSKSPAALRLSGKRLRRARSTSLCFMSSRFCWTRMLWIVGRPVVWRRVGVNGVTGRVLHPLRC